MFVYNIHTEQMFRGVVMNRKYVLKNRKRFSIFIMTAAVIFSLLLISSTARGEGVAEYPKTVIVKKGDTLWDISREYGKGTDVRRYIRKIKEVNNLKDGVIYEGDVLVLPELH
jgi:nucleoid-associated protein YgaU